MRHTYGIIDKRRVLLYKPQLFRRDKDLLIFPTTDFQKWHSNIKEYIDAIYQIDNWGMEKGNSISINEFNLARAVLDNITEEIEHLFDTQKSYSSYFYLSTLDKKHHKSRSSYTSDMRRCDTRIPVITREMKHQNLMEIVDEANREFLRARRKVEDYSNNIGKHIKEFSFYDD